MSGIIQTCKNNSRVKIKMYSLVYSHCEYQKEPELALLIQTAAEGIDYKALIQASMGSRIPIYSKVRCMKIQSSLSKAFSVLVDNRSMFSDSSRLFTELCSSSYNLKMQEDDSAHIIQFLLRFQ